MSNILTEEDVELFYKLYARLICFVNKQAKIFKSKLLSPDDFFDLPLDEKATLRDVLYNQKGYIDQFLNDQSAQELNEDELAIINSWKHFERGEFFIYKHLKKHSVFLSNSDEKKVFAVCGIYEPVESLFPYPPVLVEAVLLPFKDCIIYDGIVLGYSIRFGPGMRKEIGNAYEEAKHNFGLITQLPWSKESEEGKNDVETLKFYMKNKHNREHYRDEIIELSSKNKQLFNLFCQELGKVHASYFSKKLKEFGIEKKWFGIIENMIIASGSTKDQLQKNIAMIVLEDKVDCVYIFKT